MAQQKKGFVTRMLEGKERSEEYARSTLPTNRWQLFWDIFKGNFSKIFKVNLLTILFFIPMFIVLIMNVLLHESNGISFPFGANVGVGYPAYPDQQGVSEYLLMTGNLVMHIGLIFSMFIAAVGLAGGMYVIRNMVWTEGIFVANDFWRGVKLNYKNALQTTLFFTVIYFLCGMLINVSDLSLAIGNVTKAQSVWLRISQATSYLFITLAAMMTLWMVALGVNYKLNFPTMVKNSFLMTIGTLPQTVFFGALALLPFALFLIGNVTIIMIAAMIVIVFAFAYALLVWLNFAQWVFDKYINPKIEGAKVGRGIFNKDGSSPIAESDSSAALEYRRTILEHGRSRLVARPIKPIDDSLQVYELPTSFTREDLKKLRESKQNIEEDTEAYAEEHKNDLRYVEYNKQFDELEKSVQADMDGKNKKRKKPKILNKVDNNSSEE